MKHFQLIKRLVHSDKVMFKARIKFNYNKKNAFDYALLSLLEKYQSIENIWIKWLHE